MTEKEDNQGSEYERLVRKNIEENRKVLQSLGLLVTVEEIKKTTRPSQKRLSISAKPAQKKRDSTCFYPVRTRRSSALLETIEYNEDEPNNEENLSPKRSTKIKRAVGSPKFGDIEGVKVGDWWATRLECSAAGVHRPTVAGIHGKSGVGCYSIALSGGYEDDVDCGEYFTYTGSGGRDLKGTKLNPKNLRTAPQSKDQTFDGINEALASNVESKRPVRVIRGYKGANKYAPEEGYRYDGVYSVEKCWMATGLSGFKVCKFALKRIPGQDPPPWTVEENHLTSGSVKLDNDNESINGFGSEGTANLNSNNEVLHSDKVNLASAGKENLVFYEANDSESTYPRKPNFNDAKSLKLSSTTTSSTNCDTPKKENFFLHEVTNFNKSTSETNETFSPTKEISSESCEKNFHKGELSKSSETVNSSPNDCIKKFFSVSYTEYNPNEVKVRNSKGVTRFNTKAEHNFLLKPTVFKDIHEENIITSDLNKSNKDFDDTEQIKTFNIFKQGNVVESIALQNDNSNTIDSNEVVSILSLRNLSSSASQLHSNKDIPVKTKSTTSNCVPVQNHRIESIETKTDISEGSFQPLKLDGNCQQKEIEVFYNLNESKSCSTPVRKIFTAKESTKSCVNKPNEQYTSPNFAKKVKFSPQVTYRDEDGNRCIIPMDDDDDGQLPFKGFDIPNTIYTISDTKRQKSIKDYFQPIKRLKNTTDRHQIGKMLRGNTAYLRKNFLPKKPQNEDLNSSDSKINSLTQSCLIRESESSNGCSFKPNEPVEEAIRSPEQVSPSFSPKKVSPTISPCKVVMEKLVLPHSDSVSSANSPVQISLNVMTSSKKRKCFSKNQSGKKVFSFDYSNTSPSMMENLINQKKLSLSKKASPIKKNKEVKTNSLVLEHLKSCQVMLTRFDGKVNFNGWDYACGDMFKGFTDCDIKIAKDKADLVKTHSSLCEKSEDGFRGWE